MSTPKANNDWFPFKSQVAFELTECLYTKAELSQRKIDKLLELWAATLVLFGHDPPILNHQHLHQQINAIKVGDVKGENTTLKYDGPLPITTHPPEWMTTEYDVWHRNPHKVIKNVLANPNLNNHVDYAAYQEFNDEKRQYGNMMSGDWVWRQSVCYTFCTFDTSLSSRVLC